MLIAIYAWQSISHRIKLDNKFVSVRLVYIYTEQSLWIRRPMPTLLIVQTHCLILMPNLDMYTEPSTHPLSSLLFEPHKLVPSSEYIKTYCDQANRQKFHIWNSPLALFMHNCYRQRQRRMIGSFSCNSVVYFNEDSYMRYSTNSTQSVVEIIMRCQLLPRQGAIWEL